MHLYSSARGPDGRLHLVWVRELTKSELDLIRQMTEYLTDSVRGPRDRLAMVDDNLGEVQAFAPALLARANAGEHSPDSVAADTREVNRRVFNFLSSVRLFLDHTAKRLVRYYGKASAHQATFDAARRAAFDTSAAYRIVDALRNYVAHRGMAVDVAGLSSTLRATPDDHDLHEVVIVTDVDRLLRDDGWRHAKPDLIARAPRFDVTQLLAEVTVHLRRIHAATAASERPALEAAGRQLLATLQDGFIDGTTANVIDVEPADRGSTMHVLKLPFDELAELGLLEWIDPDSPSSSREMARARP